MCFPRSLARLLPSAVRVRIKSRSTSARPPSTASINRPVRVPVSAHGSARDRNCALASTMRLTMAKRSRVLRAKRSARHGHHVAGGKTVEHAEKFAPVRPGARYFLAVDVPAAASGRTQLFKLVLKGLPVGADTGIADKAFLAVSFGHVLR